MICETIFFKQNKEFMDGYEQRSYEVQTGESEREDKFDFSKYDEFLTLFKKNVEIVKKMISIKNDSFSELLGVHQVRVGVILVIREEEYQRFEY
jgi:hypothetical protein